MINLLFLLFVLYITVHFVSRIPGQPGADRHLHPAVQQPVPGQQRSLPVHPGLHHGRDSPGRRAPRHGHLR